MNKQNRHAIGDIPQHMYAVLPPYSQTNNARSIIRSQISRLIKYGMKGWQQMKKASWLMQAQHGIDCDYILGQDDGERMEQDPRDINPNLSL